MIESIMNEGYYNNGTFFTTRFLAQLKKEYKEQAFMSCVQQRVQFIS